MKNSLILPMGDRESSESTTKKKRWLTRVLKNRQLPSRLRGEGNDISSKGYNIEPWILVVSLVICAENHKSGDMVGWRCNPQFSILFRTELSPSTFKNCFPVLDLTPEYSTWALIS